MNIRFKELLKQLEIDEITELESIELQDIIKLDPSLRHEYLEVIQMISLQKEAYGAFVKKDYLAEAEKLMSLSLERQLKEEEAAKLEQIMKISPRARAFVMESQQCESLLTDYFQTSQDSLFTPSNEITELKTNIVSKKQNIWRWVSIAAVALIGFQTLWIMSVSNEKASLEERLNSYIQKESENQETHSKIAEIPQKKTRSASLDVRVSDNRGVLLFDSSGKKVSMNHDFSQDDYFLKKGLLMLNFAKGTSVIIEAPAIFRSLNSNKLKIDSGKAYAIVPEAAVGFTIRTPTSNIVDLGTEFGVYVNEFGYDEVHVFKGSVSVSTFSDEAPYKLKERQALHIDLETHLKTHIEINRKQFTRETIEVSHSYREKINELSPLIYYNMSPSQNVNVLEDLTGNKHHAELYDYSEFGPQFDNGLFGLAVNFNGDETKWGYIIHDFPKLDTGSYSVSAWVYARDYSNWGSIVKNWYKEEDRGLFHLGFFAKSGKLEAHVYDHEKKEEIFVIDDKPLDLGKWHHIVLTAGKGSMKLYRNGFLIGKAAIPEIRYNENTNWVSIGSKMRVIKKSGKNIIHGHSHMNGSYWDGLIDELSFFDRVLSHKEISKLAKID